MGPIRQVRGRWRLAVPGAALALVALSFASAAVPAGASVTGRAASSAVQEPSPGFNRPGNILIADQFNNRVIEVDPAGHIVWQFGEGARRLQPAVHHRHQRRSAGGRFHAHGWHRHPARG